MLNSPPSNCQTFVHFGDFVPVFRSGSFEKPVQHSDAIIDQNAFLNYPLGITLTTYKALLMKFELSFAFPRIV